jgi:hypothetical protein
MSRRMDDARVEGMWNAVQARRLDVLAVMSAPAAAAGSLSAVRRIESPDKGR